MAITNQSPVDGSLIDASATVAFTVDDTYTYLRIEVTTDDGVEYAYDSSLGGQQTGYVIALIDNGDGTDTFQITADSGWDVTPQLITVIEDETGSEATTILTWLLAGTVTYPNEDDPYYSEQGGGFQISEDNVSVVVNVTHLDFIKGAVDGIEVTDLGGGKVRLTARAATTDPYAIHTNEASEISALTEKVLPDNDDLVVVEDSTDGNAKKKVKKTNMGGARMPQKFGSDYDATWLYTFDGDTDEKITGTHDLNVRTFGGLYYCNGIVPATKALYMYGDNGQSSTPALVTEAQACSEGDFTLQAVLHPGRATPEGSGTTDQYIIKMNNDYDNDVVFGMGWFGGNIIMRFGMVYNDDGGISSHHGLTSADCALADGVPCHMVARHWTEDGGTTWINEILVNNTRVAYETGAPNMRPWQSTRDHIMYIGKHISASGMCRASIDGVKVSNRKMTDVEVEIEYRKVLGYPVS